MSIFSFWGYSKKNLLCIIDTRTIGILKRRKVDLLAGAVSTPLPELTYFLTGSKAKKTLSAMIVPAFPFSIGMAGTSKTANCTSSPRFKAPAGQLMIRVISRLNGSMPKSITAWISGDSYPQGNSLHLFRKD